MEKKPIIKLRTYRGREINYDANGKIKNENNLVSLDYGTKIWALFMKNLPLNGYCKVDVEKAFKVTGNGYEPIEDLSVYQKEVKEAFNPKKEVALTDDQKRIAELEAKIEAMAGGKKVEEKKQEKPEDKKEGDLKNDDTSSDKATLQEEYSRIFKKKPFHGWTSEQLAEKIEESKK